MRLLTRLLAPKAVAYAHRDVYDPAQARVKAESNVGTVQAPGRTPDRPCVDCLDQPPAAGRTRPAVASRVAFWLAALILSITMLGTTLPTPLYVIYQDQWHFSAAIVTVTFAVYAVAVLATLLLAGRSSDQAGRKPVLAAALAASALSTIVFILAPNVGVLIVGRILSGLSAGLMTGTATAALTELVPASASRRASLVATAANMGGLALGPSSPGSSPSTRPIPPPWSSRCTWPCWRSRACACSSSRKQ